MKQWKIIVGTIVVVLWIATIIVIAKSQKSDSVAPAAIGNVKQAQARIAELKVVAEEQRLITEILTLRYDAAVIQSKMQPAQKPVQPPTP